MTWWVNVPYNIKILKDLVEKGADINSVNEFGETLLHFAVSSQYVKFTKYLIEHGAVVNCQDNRGKTVLHNAADFQTLEIVQYLVEHGADVNCKDKDGRTALFNAAQVYALDIIEYLVEHGADVNCKDKDRGKTVLHSVVVSHGLHVVEYLVERGVDINCKDNDDKTALHFALQYRSPNVVKYLVEHDADVSCKDKNGKTVLHYAVESCLPGIIMYLVEHGADGNCKDAEDRSVLHTAVRAESLDNVKYLVEDCGAVVNCKDKDGETVLFGAVAHCSPDMVKYLVEHGADVNCKNKDGRTVLHLGVAYHSLGIVMYLVEHGADANCKDAQGRSVLHTAVQVESLENVKYLVEYCSAEVNCKDNYGETVLQSAVDTDSLDIVKCLVAHGADVTCKSEHGMSTNSDTFTHSGNETQDKSTTDVNGLGNDILKMAVFGNSVHLVELLIQKGIDVTKAEEVLVEGRQTSLIAWSSYHGHHEITHILKIQLKKSVKHRDKIQMLKTMKCNQLNKMEVPIHAFVANSEFKIGKGSSATCVYVGVMKDGSEVAVKRILTQSGEDTAENEREILSLIDTTKSPYIVSYRHCLHDDIFTYLIVDLCEETLNEHVHSQTTEYLRKYGPRIIKEVLTGLKFLHEEGILHRDLKPTNILVDSQGHMRLADFGISRVLNEDETTVETDAKGTGGWMPAEVIKAIKCGGKSHFKKKSDVQVAGMIAYFLVTKGEHPFGSSLDRMKNILNGNPVNLKKLDYRSARKFVSWLISHKIDDRPYAHEALTHPFVVREVCMSH